MLAGALMGWGSHQGDAYHMLVHDEVLFHRASGNLLKLAVALFFLGAVMAYFGFAYFRAESFEQGRMRLAIRIGSGVLLYGGLKAALIRNALAKSVSS